MGTSLREPQRRPHRAVVGPDSRAAPRCAAPRSRRRPARGCGRSGCAAGSAGQVRPRTVRRQPGRNVLHAGTPEVAVAGDDAGAAGRRAAAAASRRSWIGGPYGRRDDRCTPTRSTVVPSTSSTTCSAAAFGRRVAEHGPDREASARLGRDAAEHRRGPRHRAPLPSARHVRPGIEPGPTEPELEHLGTDRRRRRCRTAATPPSGVHDSCRTITSASKPAQDRVEVVGRRRRRCGGPAGRRGS